MSKNRPVETLQKPSFLAWPGWAFLRFAGLLSAADTVWFILIYGGCNWITAHRALRVPIYLPIELSIPLVPAAVVFYTSIYLLFLAGPFIVRERLDFCILMGALALATLLGAIGFLLLPSQPAFAPPGDFGIWTSLFHFADRLNLDYNMVPSLHVALSVCCISAFAQRTSAPGRWVLWLWAVTIALSTLLTHQHHLLDVITGWGVGLFSFRIAEDTWGKRERR